MCVASAVPIILKATDQLPLSLFNRSEARRDLRQHLGRNPPASAVRLSKPGDVRCGLLLGSGYMRDVDSQTLRCVPVGAPDPLRPIAVCQDRAAVTQTAAAAAASTEVAICPTVAGSGAIAVMTRPAVIGTKSKSRATRRNTFVAEPDAWAGWRISMVSADNFPLFLGPKWRRRVPDGARRVLAIMRDVNWQRQWSER